MEAKLSKDEAKCFSKYESKAKGLLDGLEHLVETKVASGIAEQSLAYIKADPFVVTVAFMELLLNGMSALRQLNKDKEVKALTEDLKHLLDHPEDYEADLEDEEE
jgi:hypothetical protein